jgi:hypothetical protein
MVAVVTPAPVRRRNEGVAVGLEDAERLRGDFESEFESAIPWTLRVSRWTAELWHRPISESRDGVSGCRIAGLCDQVGDFDRGSG